jgi:2-polyprenyl-3-methyl-5-hydroxy-6-metoxy-1,4-benzoquinol methylase
MIGLSHRQSDIRCTVGESKTELTAKIRADFDRIALLTSSDWGVNSHYHKFLMKHIPSRCTESLDIGCGTGSLSRLLATRSDRVLALDLSPHMIQVAKTRSEAYPNIDFRVTDVTAWEFPTERFDCIASIATLHHLPLEEMLYKMKRALKNGGSLVILDLFEETGLRDVLTSALAIPVNIGLTLVKTGQLRESRQVREAWAEHGRHDSYPALFQIRRACADILPGARARKHLLWRYSLVWRKAT